MTVRRGLALTALAALAGLAAIGLLLGPDGAGVGQLSDEAPVVTSGRITTTAAASPTTAAPASTSSPAATPAPPTIDQGEAPAPIPTVAAEPPPARRALTPSTAPSTTASTVATTTTTTEPPTTTTTVVAAATTSTTCEPSGIVALGQPCPTAGAQAVTIVPGPPAAATAPCVCRAGADGLRWALS